MPVARRLIAQIPTSDHAEGRLTPMLTEREKLFQGIDDLKKNIGLAWLEVISKPMTAGERQELCTRVESLVRELDNL